MADTAIAGANPVIVISVMLAPPLVIPPSSAVS
jgi:hypothetical protein